MGNQITPSRAVPGIDGYPDTPVTEQLTELPMAQRREVLECLVVREFRYTLRLPEDTPLALDVACHEVGLTPPHISETMQRLESLFGRRIGISILFERPTVAALVAHLADDLLTDLFEDVDKSIYVSRTALWDDVLRSLHDD